MLTAAFVILAIAVLLGCLLAMLYLRTEGAAAPWPLAGLHGLVAVGGLYGLVAVGGLFCLALALRGPLRGAEQGTADFGIIAVTLIGAAGLIGVLSLVTRLLKRRIPGILIGIHATLAVGGFAILAAYVFVG
jgi:hypothetical protein